MERPITIRNPTRPSLGSLVTYLLGVCVLVLVLLINWPSLVGLFLSIILVIVLTKLFFPELGVSLPVRLHLLYCILAILLYLAQYAALPEYKGLSGPRGIGTDDQRYYVLASPISIGTPEESHYRDQSIPYGTFLSWWGNLVYRLTHQIHLIDLLVFSVISLTFTPIVVSKFALLITNNPETARYALLFSALCPFTLANGLILLSDVWTGLCIISGIYFLLKEEYLRLAVVGIFLSFLRAEAVLLLLANLLVIITYQQFKRSSVNSRTESLKKLTILFATCLALGAITIAIFPWATSFMETKGIGPNMLRDSYIEGFMADSMMLRGSSSPLYAISRLPIPLRIPLSTAFFIGAPFISFDNLYFTGITGSHYYSNVLIPRNLLFNSYAILFLVFYLRYFVNAVLSSLKRRFDYSSLFVLLYVLNAATIAMVSLQGRHKSWFMPLFYIVVADGKKRHTSQIIPILIQFILLFVELYTNFH